MLLSFKLQPIPILQSYIAGYRRVAEAAALVFLKKQALQFIEIL